jgi:electron transport complex protein RnfG
MFRIALSMTITCALGAAILGAIFVLTDRYQEAARVKSEQNAVTQMLGLDSSATVAQIQQYLDSDKQQVIYRTDTAELVFNLDGKLIQQGKPAATHDLPKQWKPLGRIFVATKNGAPLGFVTEGETQGYKNKIRFFVAIDSNFDVAGVRVIEHEEDPGLGAEVATPWFQGQYVGRKVANLQNVEVSRDPMPEDWSAALHEREKTDSTAWRNHYANLLERENTTSIYAVTGATISSRALTNGVRTTAHHFERRWSLLAPYFGGANEHAD